MFWLLFHLKTTMWSDSEVLGLIWSLLSTESACSPTEAHKFHHLSLLRKWWSSDCHRDSVTGCEFNFFEFCAFCFCTQVDGSRLFKDVKAYHTAVKGRFLMHIQTQSAVLTEHYPGELVNNGEVNLFLFLDPVWTEVKTKDSALDMWFMCRKPLCF